MAVFFARIAHSLLVLCGVQVLVAVHYRAGNSPRSRLTEELAACAKNASPPIARWSFSSAKKSRAAAVVSIALPSQMISWSQATPTFVKSVDKVPQSYSALFVTRIRQPFRFHRGREIVEANGDVQIAGNAHFVHSTSVAVASANV